MNFRKTPSNQLWAMSESALAHIIALANEHQTTPETIAANLGKQLESDYASSTVDNVAVLPVVGPLLRYTSFFSRLVGASTYERLTQDFSQALNNPEISQIILDIDSPGGEVNGCAELANRIYDARGTKRIIAYASGDCASGAYWIASACDSIVVSETAQLGSIGVVATYQKSTADDDTIEIVSSQSPFKRLDLNENADRQKIQTRIDALADVFINAVAKFRSVTPDTVKATYGQGDVFVGQTAVERGLADSGGTLEKLMAQAPPDPILRPSSIY